MTDDMGKVVRDTKHVIYDAYIYICFFSFSNHNFFLVLMIVSAHLKRLIVCWNYDFLNFTINSLKYTIYSMKILLLEEGKGWGERMLVFAHLLVIIFIHFLNYLFDSQNYQNKPCVPYLFSISYILFYFSIGYIAS